MSGRDRAYRPVVNLPGQLRRAVCLPPARLPAREPEVDWHQVEIVRASSASPGDRLVDAADAPAVILDVYHRDGRLVIKTDRVTLYADPEDLVELVRLVGPRRSGVA